MNSQLSYILQVAAGAIGFTAYVPMTYAILKKNAQQSFAAFFLWGLLDTIAMVSTFLEDGNFWLPLSNVVGASFIAVLLVIKKQVSWSRVETMTSILVLICIAIWYTSGDTGAIIASSIAVVIASIPQMVDTYKNPEGTPIGIYFIWLAANILSLFAGKAWTISERFYAVCGIVLCISIISMAFIPNKDQHEAMEFIPDESPDDDL